MAYRIEFTRAAQRGLASLPSDIKQRAAQTIDALAENPRPSGAKALQGHTNLLRIRIRDDRIIYTVEDDVLSVLVVRVAHRREAYRNV